MGKKNKINSVIVLQNNENGYPRFIVNIGYAGKTRPNTKILIDNYAKKIRNSINKLEKELNS